MPTLQKPQNTRKSSRESQNTAKLSQRKAAIKNEKIQFKATKQCKTEKSCQNIEKIY
jgi:hypothetical protein